MEPKPGLARPRQDVDEAGATVQKQLSLVQKQLLSAMNLVGRQSGEGRRVEKEKILAAQPQLPHRTGCDMENQESEWNRMGYYLKMIMEKVESAQANVETVQNVLSNKDPKRKEPKRQTVIDASISEDH